MRWVRDRPLPTSRWFSWQPRTVSPTRVASGGHPRVRSDHGCAVRPRRRACVRSGRGRRPDRAALARHPAAACCPSSSARRRASNSRRSRATTTPGPAWYWNNFRTGEHTGTHFDAPIHWVTGQGRRGRGVGAAGAAGRARGGARLLGARRARTPTSSSRSTTSRRGRSSTVALPDGGWLLVRTGWDARAHSQEEFLNADENGPHTPGLSAECAQWVAQESPVIGMGVETVGSDAGAAATLRPDVPLPLVHARRGKVRADPVAQPRPAAADRRGA